MGGGNGNFLKKVSSQSWQRGDNPFYEDYLYIVYPPPPSFPNFAQPTPLPISHFPVTSWFPSLSGDIWCAILLNHNMGLHMLSLVIFSPDGPWCVFHATRHQVYWGLTHNVAFYWVYITHTNTQMHTAHSGVGRLTHSYKYIFTPPVMCSQQLPLLH